MRTPLRRRCRVTTRSSIWPASMTARPTAEEQYIATNVTGNWNVLEAAEHAGVRHVVVASSVAAYGLRPGRKLELDYLPVDEAHPLRADDAYGLSKHLIEITCENLAARGPLRIVCLRPTLILQPESELAVLAQLALPDPDADPPPEAVAGDGARPSGALSRHSGLRALARRGGVLLPGARLRGPTLRRLQRQCDGHYRARAHPAPHRSDPREASGGAATRGIRTQPLRERARHQPRPRTSRMGARRRLEHRGRGACRTECRVAPHPRRAP